jgi:hypothetical protein
MNTYFGRLELVLFWVKIPHLALAYRWQIDVTPYVPAILYLDTILYSIYVLNMNLRRVHNEFVHLTTIHVFAESEASNYWSNK